MSRQKIKVSLQKKKKEMLSPPEKLVFVFWQVDKTNGKSQVEAVKVKEGKNKLAAES